MGEKKRDPRICPQCGDSWSEHDTPEPLAEHTIQLLSDPDLPASEIMLSLGGIMNNAYGMLAGNTLPIIVQQYLGFYATIIADTLKRREKIELLRKEHDR